MAVAIVVALNPRDFLYLVVDDTLLHKRGKHVYGLGWFRDAVASTAKRVATASGNHWVVIGLAICIPGTNKIYCLPIYAKLHLAGKNHPSEATLAKEMLQPTEMTTDPVGVGLPLGPLTETVTVDAWTVVTLNADSVTVT